MEHGDQLMGAELRAHFVPLIAVLTAVAGLGWTTSTAHAEFLVSSFPGDGWQKAAEQKLMSGGDKTHTCAYEPFGSPAAQLMVKSVARRRRTETESKILAERLGIMAAVMFLPPSDGTLKTDDKVIVTDKPTDVVVTDKPTDGTTTVKNTPEPATLIGGLSGACLMALMLWARYRRQGRLALAA
jgi:hypothetical protein